MNVRRRDIAFEDMISRQDIEAFLDEGFVIKRGFLAEQARQIAGRTGEIAGWPELPGKYMMYFESSLARSDERLLSRIENFHPYHHGFCEFLTGPAIQNGVASLFGEPAVLFKDKINFKLPGADGFKPHQDVQAGWDRYASLHITALVTIDAATPENGCLEIASGRHTRALIGRMWEPLDDAATEGITFVHCIGEPGDVVFSIHSHRIAPAPIAAQRRDACSTLRITGWLKAITGCGTTPTSAGAIHPTASASVANSIASGSDDDDKPQNTRDCLSVA